MEEDVKEDVSAAESPRQQLFDEWGVISGTQHAADPKDDTSRKHHGLNSRLLNEEMHLLQRWEKTRLLTGLRKEDKGVCAVLLENQRLWNETMTDTGDIAQFKRISIPLIRRIVGSWHVNHLVSTQVMLGPTSQVFFMTKTENKLVIDSRSAMARTMKFKTVWAYEAQQDLRSQHNLDQEATLTATLADELAMEFDRLVVTELKDAAAIKKIVRFDRIRGLWATKMEAARQQIDAVVADRRMYDGGSPDWMVTSPQMAETLVQNYLAPRSSLRMNRAGEYAADGCTLAVYADPLLGAGEMLFGRRGDGHDAGAVFAPYILLMQTPTVLDPVTFTPKKGLLTRYDFQVVNDTAFSYLNLEGFKRPGETE